MRDEGWKAAPPPVGITHSPPSGPVETSFVWPPLPKITHDRRLERDEQQAAVALRRVLAEGIGAPG